MDIQADIRWIKSELDNVNDPDFVEVLKSMLYYRKKKVAEMDVELKELLTSRALKSEADINAGRVYSITESIERIRIGINK